MSEAFVSLFTQAVKQKTIQTYGYRNSPIILRFYDDVNPTVLGPALGGGVIGDRLRVAFARRKKPAVRDPIPIHLHSAQKGYIAVNAQI
jgi:hypothetical protein